MPNKPTDNELIMQALYTLCRVVNYGTGYSYASDLEPVMRQLTARIHSLQETK